MFADKAIGKILDEIQSDELVALTAELVKRNTVWDPQAGTSETPAADFIAQWALNEGFEVVVNEVAPKRPNVVITWQAGRGSRTLMFEGHTDVVTPGDVAAWSYDPFGAEIVGQRMYGRGTNDTKGNLAAMLIAMAAIKRSGIPLSGTIIGGVLCDEEGMMTGVLDFIDRGHADSVTAAIICEPQDGIICNSQKGAIRAEFTITGRMSHGAMPLSGLNTAPAVAQLLIGIRSIEDEAIRSFGRDDHLGWPSFTPTVIQAPAMGPGQLNVIPGESRILVDIRTIPGQSHDRARALLTKLASTVASEVNIAYARQDGRIGLERQHDLAVRVDFLTDRPCTYTDEDQPVVRAAHWAVQTVTGKSPEYGGVPGATDGTFLWSMKNIPIVTMGAGDRHVPHQKDEWVDLGQLMETARIYALSALKYLTP